MLGLDGAPKPFRQSHLNRNHAPAAVALDDSGVVNEAKPTALPCAACFDIGFNARPVETLEHFTHALIGASACIAVRAYKEVIGGETHHTPHVLTAPVHGFHKLANAVDPQIFVVDGRAPVMPRLDRHRYPVALVGAHAHIPGLQGK